MLREIENYIIALRNDIIKYADNRLVYPLCRPGYCNFGIKSTSPSQLSCATFTIYNLVHQIMGMSVIDTISDRFSLISDISLSFGTLSLVKEIYEYINQKYLNANLIIQGSKIWKKKLFHDLGESYYKAKVDLRDSLQ